jgi:hypothetical protein
MRAASEKDFFGSPTPQSADIGILFRYLRRSPSSAEPRDKLESIVKKCF